MRTEVYYFNEKIHYPVLYYTGTLLVRYTINTCSPAIFVLTMAASDQEFCSSSAVFRAYMGKLIKAIQSADVPEITIELRWAGPVLRR